METENKKGALLSLSLFILMYILTALPLLFPNRVELIESGLYLPYCFLIEFFFIVPIYFLKFIKKEGFGAGNFSLMQFIIFFSLILIIQFIIPIIFFHQDKEVVNHQQPLLSLYVIILTQISYILLVPVYEEISIRGGLFGSLEYFLKSKVLAACITSLIFSLLHTQYSGLKPFVLLYLISLTLVAARIFSNGLLLPVLLHVLMNGMVINGSYLLKLI